MFKVTDPETKKPALRNIFLAALISAVPMRTK